MCIRDSHHPCCVPTPASLMRSATYGQTTRSAKTEETTALESPARTAPTARTAGRGTTSPLRRRPRRRPRRR
eukprot:scaffold12519_cov24-Phaeocystis_antarctica.AAC.1